MVDFYIYLDILPHGSVSRQSWLRRYLRGHKLSLRPDMQFSQASHRASKEARTRATRMQTTRDAPAHHHATTEVSPVSARTLGKAESGKSGIGKKRNREKAESGKVEPVAIELSQPRDIDVLAQSSPNMSQTETTIYIEHDSAGIAALMRE